MHSICEGKSRHTTLVKTYSWTASLLFARSISFWTASWHTGHPSGSYISSKSIRARISCLLTFWVFFPHKSFKFIDIKTRPKMPIYLVILKKKALCNTLNWGNWISGFVKLAVRWAEWDIKWENAECSFRKYFSPLCAHCYCTCMVGSQFNQSSCLVPPLALPVNCSKRSSSWLPDGQYSYQFQYLS